MKKFIKNIACFGVITGLLLETFPVWALVKDETIYAKLENNGQVNTVIVSEHLQDTDENETIDKSRLTDIQNVNGEEKFTSENGKVVWESNGNDIYYQGKTKEELPISLKISYYLNGEETPIKDMLGKKGNVKIVLKYTNNDKHVQNINGKSTTLYTPFVVATTTILSNTDNKNISVTNGKVIGTGTNSIIVMLSTPGLYESLGIDKLKGMDEATISFDTDSFELSSIYSVSTPKLVDSSDLDIFNNIDGLYNSINTLVSSSNKIKSGSSQLLQGANTLKDGITKLKEGISKLYNGSKQITNGVSNSIDQLNKDNSESISNDKLTAIKTQAEAGATKKIDATFTDEYKKNIGNQAVQALDENSDYQKLKAGVNAAIKKYESIDGFTDLVKVCSAEEIPQQLLPTCQQNSENIQSYVLFKSIIGAIENTARNTAISTAYQTASTVAKETAGSTSTTIAKMVADEAKKTAKEQTTESLKTLLEGLNSLTNGLGEVNTKMVSLDQGTTTLTDGIASLDSGISQFNSQGINKISDFVNGDVKSLEEKLKALGKLSANYKTFDDIEDGTEGVSKIIMIVDEIKVTNAKINTVDKIIEDKESLWEKANEENKKEK